MNPWLELSWPDVHTRLIGYILDVLSERVPDDLTVRGEQQVSVERDDDRRKKERYRLDVGITGPREKGFPPVWRPNQSSSAGLEGGVQVATPILRPLEDVVERWVEIRGPDGELLTVIEVLSPANKLQNRREYLNKQRTLQQGGVNVVEIDLLRQGEPTALGAPDPETGAPYCVSVYRGHWPDCVGVYPLALTMRLPAFQVPLRPEDTDAILDLQAMIDRVHETGRYWKASYRRTLQPPLSAEELEWTRQRLSAAGLLGEG